MLLCVRGLRLRGKRERRVLKCKPVVGRRRALLEMADGCGPAEGA